MPRKKRQPAAAAQDAEPCTVVVDSAGGIPARVASALQIADVPDTLPGATEAMADYINRGRRYALGLAVLATRVRHRDFPDDPSGWLTWARDSFGYERRFCFQLLSVGNLLMSVHHDALT